MEVDYKNPEFYCDEVRSQFEITDKVKVNSLPTFEMVKSYYEVHLFSDGYVGVFNGKKYLKPHIADYFRYGLRTIDNKSRNAFMHRLMGFAWIEGYSDGLVIDHLSGDKLQNQSNLEWVTNLENVLRQKERLLGKKSLTFDLVESIFSLYDDGKTEVSIAKDLNVTQPCISQILAGKRWKEHPASKLYMDKLNVM